MDTVSFLSLLTLLSNAFALIVLLLFASKWFFQKGKLWARFSKLMAGTAYKAGFVIALTATLGSLYLSDVRGFTPCLLCWYQRIFMYPLLFIFGTALVKKLKGAENFVLPLSITGAAIAAYHYYLQITPDPLVPCSTVGFSVSCSDRFVTSYGYITIPWMALSAFGLITILMLIKARVKK